MSNARRPDRIPPSTLRNIERKRFQRRLRSLHIRKLKRGGIVSKRNRRRYRIRPVDLFARARWQAQRGKLRKAHVDIPDVLSFYQRPYETSAFVNGLTALLDKHYRMGKAFVYDFSHERTRQLGLAESFLFDRIVGRHRERWQKQNITIGFSGKISGASKEVNNFLLAFGWLRELGIDPMTFGPKYIDRDYAKKYETYKMSGSRVKNDDKSRGSIELIQYFDKCLRHNGFKIKEAAKSDLVAGVGEIIGNAEEHSGTKEGNWHVLGCYNKDSHSCEFAIVNFGRTIFQTLSDKSSTAAEVIRDVEEIILSHRSIYDEVKDFLTSAVLHRLNQEEPIWNVMALQDGISSQRTLGGAVGNTRGQGIMDFLTFVSGIKTPESAEIILLSGHSLIRIDFSYPIVTKLVGPNKDEPRRRMVFNKEGNLLLPSDAEKVIYLKDKFPGTVFAGRFRIDEQHLIDQSVGGTKHGGN